MDSAATPPTPLVVARVADIGGNVRAAPLTLGTDLHYNVTRAPQGDRLALERFSTTANQSSVVVIQADGTGARTSAAGLSPRWSP
ncbi:MAG TPA: hypothetical protein VGD56_13200 [Gemmatirosa sp.]